LFSSFVFSVLGTAIKRSGKIGTEPVGDLIARGVYHATWHGKDLSDIPKDEVQVLVSGYQIRAFLAEVCLRYLFVPCSFFALLQSFRSFLSATPLD
jgi:hypothetical protein